MSGTNISLRQEVLDFCKAQYGTAPEYLWARNPNYAILRHKSNNKWYAAVLDIPKNKLGIPNSEIVDVLNVKCDVLLAGSFLKQKGIYPAYHMSKDKWLSVLLDGTVDMEQIKFLIDLSYELTNIKKKK